MEHAAGPGALAAGQLWRMQALGTVSTYRVVELDGPLVLVEVVSVPGLEPGTRVRLTQEAVTAMELVDASASPTRGSIADAA